MVVCYDPELGHRLVKGYVTISKSKHILMSQWNVTIQLSFSLEICLILGEEYFHRHMGILIRCFINSSVASLAYKKGLYRIREIVFQYVLYIRSWEYEK